MSVLCDFITAMHVDERDGALEAMSEDLTASLFSQRRNSRPRTRECHTGACRSREAGPRRTRLGIRPRHPSRRRPGAAGSAGVHIGPRGWRPRHLAVPKSLTLPPRFVTVTPLKLPVT